jgi:hypothetical protein
VKGAPLRIVVRGTDGRVVPEASVTIVASTVAMPEIALLADRDGIVRLTLPRGRFELEAIGLDDERGFVSIETDGVDPLETEIVLAAK